MLPNHMRVFDYNPRDERRRSADKAGARHSRLISRVRKHFEENDENSDHRFQSGASGVVLLTEGPKTRT